MQPLLAALLLGLREAEPLCGVAAEVLCDAMQVAALPEPDLPWLTLTRTRTRTRTLTLTLILTLTLTLTLT